MRRLSVIVVLSLVAATAQAEPLPAYVLDKDYQNCVGDDRSPDRATYCGCMREGMKNWDVDTYTQTAMQAVASNASGGQITGTLADLSKICLAKALH